MKKQKERPSSSLLQCTFSRTAESSERCESSLQAYNYCSLLKFFSKYKFLRAPQLLINEPLQYRYSKSLLCIPQQKQRSTISIDTHWRAKNTSLQKERLSNLLQRTNFSPSHSVFERSIARPAGTSTDSPWQKYPTPHIMNDEHSMSDCIDDTQKGE